MTRTYGLSGSGMDVDQLVKDMMKAQKQRYTTMQQKKTQMEWKKTDYNTMYTALNEFRSNTVLNYKMQSTLLPKKVTTDNDTVATVTANAEAGNITHSLVVNQLAEGVKKTSSTAISVPKASKESLATQFGMDSAEPEFKITLKNGEKSKDFTIKPGGSVYDLVNDINKAGIDVVASYDATLDRFFLQTTNSGDKSSIQITDATLKNGALKDKSFVKDILKIDTTTANGKNAKFSLDGIGTGAADDPYFEMQSNTFTISGMTYNLKNTGTVKATVTADIDKTIAAVKSFVDTYNTMIGKLNTEVAETKYKDFLPLTDEQKKEMTESDIKLWEEKAHSGLLRNDSILRTTINDMRSALSTPVKGLPSGMDRASSIGINTTLDWRDKGKLEVSETTLRKALEADPSIVYKIFGSQGEKVEEQGVAVRLYDVLQSASKKISLEAGATASASTDTTSSLGKAINKSAQDLTELNKKLKTMEEQYYKKFDAMEKALSQLNKQSSWLSQQLGTR